MTSIQFLALIASTEARDVRLSVARQVLSIARAPASGVVQSLIIPEPGGAEFQVPVRLVATAPLPAEVSSVRVGLVRGLIDGVMLIINDELDVSFVDSGEAVAIKVVRAD